MKRTLFGTDGVRGVANTKLTPELAFQLGLGAGRWLQMTDLPKRVVTGRDTRISGTMLDAALSAGFASAGVSVVQLGVVPTPTVSYIVRTQGFGLGAVVSASHNPAPDNGIKFFAASGSKMPDAVEAEVERLMVLEAERPTGGAVGSISQDESLVEAYVEFLKSLVPEGLGGLKVAVDAAHGAGYKLGPRVLRELGAEVSLVGASPDGININADGGATKPETIQKFTVESRAEIGVAFDGDADRCIFSDGEGRLINGDRTIGMWAIHEGCDVVVGTVMSNGGFEVFLTSRGIRLERAPVGDKYVAQRITDTAARIGGEQSGHIIFPHLGPTGDGLVTMLETLRVIRESGRSAAQFFDDYLPWPQIMVNVGVASKDGLDELLAEPLAIAESELRGHGRINVRPSGTQPMIRVMVEADDYGLRDGIADRIVQLLLDKMGGHVHGRVDLTYALGD